MQIYGYKNVKNAKRSCSSIAEIKLIAKKT